MTPEQYMTRALELAQRALETGDVPVGCVVVDRHGTIIGEGWNRREANGDALAHAEVEAIRAAEADVVFVCLGAPKQEKWIARFGLLTGAKMAIGLGGALDVFAGNVERAPEKWQKMGMEWAYRLSREPKRFGRMAKLPLVLVKAAGQRVTGRRRPGVL